VKSDTVSRKVQELAEKWFAGELSTKKFAEMIAELLNAEEKDNVRN
jgi:hypothetical protein